MYVPKVMITNLNPTKLGSVRKLRPKRIHEIGPSRRVERRRRVGGLRDTATTHPAERDDGSCGDRSIQSRSVRYADTRFRFGARGQGPILNSAPRGEL
jgi:hypothetical protein